MQKCNVSTNFIIYYTIDHNYEYVHMKNTEVINVKSLQTVLVGNYKRMKQYKIFPT